MDTLVISENDLRGFPGTIPAEYVDEENIEMYLGLSQHSNWRLLLSNSNTCSFVLDDFTWSCVDQYIAYKKFEHNNVVATAIKTTGINGFVCGSISRKWSRTLSPEEVEKFESNKLSYEYDALMAKFTQNPELSNVLLLTKNAKLVCAVKFAGLVECEMLMKIRDKMRN